MKMNRISHGYGEDYEFSYTDKNLFEAGAAWCPLFGELPIIFDNGRKYHVADRCLDIVIAARDLWEIPYPYFSNGPFVTHLALSNPNWPDPEEIPEFDAEIIAARSIVWWNHYHIVTNARDYCKNTQYPYPDHWHENDAGLLHYAREMHHFTQPGGVVNEKCPLLMYPPGSPEEAAFLKYERNIAMQEEAQKVPDHLVFAALAIAEAWEILTENLYYGQRDRNAQIQRDLNIANKFLEKAQKLKIKVVINEAENGLKERDRKIVAMSTVAKLGTERHQHCLKISKTSIKERSKQAKKNMKEWIDAAKPIKDANPDLYNKSRSQLANKIIQKFGLEEKRKPSVYAALKILYK